ncbi:MAG: YeeE/YedE family protein [Litorimonas sp.]
MENFTPLSAMIGGVLIGLSAVMLMAFNGRIAGISGLFSGVAFAQQGDRLWRLLFVIGLIISPLLYQAVTGHMPTFDLAANTPWVIVGGLLVGFGTRLGSGCTSGHGVCGLSRLSPRSLLSVFLFMGAGMLTVTLIRTAVGG